MEVGSIPLGLLRLLLVPQQPWRTDEIMHVRSLVPKVMHNKLFYYCYNQEPIFSSYTFPSCLDIFHFDTVNSHFYHNHFPVFITHVLWCEDQCTLHEVFNYPNPQLYWILSTLKFHLTRAKSSTVPCIKWRFRLGCARLYCDNKSP